MNTYYIRARLFPTILTSIPLILFYNKILAPPFCQPLKDIYSGLPVIVNVSLSAAIIFLFVQINRIISKEVFQKIFFQDELKMPSTDHLLWQNTVIDSDIKTTIRDKIKTIFSIELLAIDAEKADEQKARKMITVAVSQVRNVLRDNKLLFQHNIEYGFFRNLIGGSLLALVFSIVLFIYGYYNQDSNLRTAGLLMVLIYLLPLLASKAIINRFGKYYAKVLYEQFLTIK